MRFEATTLAGLFAVRLDWQEDTRGGFARLFDRAQFTERGLPAGFVQVSLSRSRQAGTLRGLHFQRAPHGEVKLVRCVRGEVYDVVADLRPASPTYLRWQGFALRADGDLALCIPEGCAHGFQTLVDDCELLYQMSVPYAPSHADGVRYDDPAFGVAWPRAISVISPRDQQWPHWQGRHSHSLAP